MQRITATLVLTMFHQTDADLQERVMTHQQIPFAGVKAFFSVCLLDQDIV